MKNKTVKHFQSLRKGEKKINLKHRNNCVLIKTGKQLIIYIAAG